MKLRKNARLFFFSSVGRGRGETAKCRQRKKKKDFITRIMVSHVVRTIATIVLKKKKKSSFCGAKWDITCKTSGIITYEYTCPQYQIKLYRRRGGEEKKDTFFPPPPQMKREIFFRSHIKKTWGHI